MKELISLLHQPSSVLLVGNDTWLPGEQAVLLHDPCSTTASHDPARVPDVLREAEDQLKCGRLVMLCLSYEASAVFELSTYPVGGPSPAAWMAAYPANNAVSLDQRDLWPLASICEIDEIDLQLNVSDEEYKSSVAAIKELIASGDTYQVNYTCHARFSFHADPLGYFLTLARSHPVPYAAFVNMADSQVISLSPELLVSRRGDILESRPMKGTRRRGRTRQEDLRFAEELVDSEKDRAENVMILDMMRNDLGKICRMGSINVPEMFRAEKYRSVWQMTSRVVGEAAPNLTLNDIAAAVFPGSSITGAPKRRTMEIIRDLEREPRGLYTGTIGIFTPEGDFTCNLPIRTLIHREGKWDLGIGSGIVWDSDPQAEYEETLLKSQFAVSVTPHMYLFETMLVTPSAQIAFRDEHLDRIEGSADYWDIPFDRNTVLEELERFIHSLDDLPIVIRMELDQDGEVRFVPRPAPEAPAEPVRVALSSHMTNSQDRLLFHKTNLRKLYQQELELAHKQGFFEVLFRNENGCLTEGAITNMFIRKGNDWFTPQIADGLLPGVWRQSYINETCAAERSITVDDLASADEVVIGNSVRGAIRAEVISVDDEPTGTAPS